MVIKTKKAGLIIGLLSSISFAMLGIYCAWLGFSSHISMMPSQQEGIFYSASGIVIGICFAVAGVIYNNFSSAR